MKNLLIGLLALGSISTFAAEDANNCFYKGHLKSLKAIHTSLTGDKFFTRTSSAEECLSLANDVLINRFDNAKGESAFYTKVSFKYVDGNKIVKGAIKRDVQGQ